MSDEYWTIEGLPLPKELVEMGITGATVIEDGGALEWYAQDKIDLDHPAMVKELARWYYDENYVLRRKP